MSSRKTRNASSSEVYQTLSSLFDFPDEEQKLWWHSTAPMFADMLHTANYDTHAQYRHLGIYKKYVIPFLGVYPTNDRDRWLSILTRYGTPFELSLNCSDDVVRYTFEPINAATGTIQDPFNTHAIWDCLQNFSPMLKGVDLEWFSYFKERLTLNADESAFLVENNLADDPIKTQNKLALDLKNSGFVLKTYIYPALKSIATGKSIWELMFNSVSRLSPQYPGLAAPLSVIDEYVQSRGPNGTAGPRLFSCDLVHPSKSRIKIYILERMVSLAAMEDLWTLGGRRKDHSTLAGLNMIRELWELIQLPAGLRSYPEPYLPLGTIPNEQLPLMANYTLHQDDPWPEPQVYFTPFGMNDMAIADALTTFMDRRGWNDMAQSYKDNLCSYYPNADHDHLNYVHAYISFSYRNDKPYLSVYLHSFETGDWKISNFTNPESKCKEPHRVSVRFPVQGRGRGRIPASGY